MGMVSSFGWGSYTQSYWIMLKWSNSDKEWILYDKIWLKLTIAVTISGDGDELLKRLPAFRICQEFKSCFEKSLSNENIDVTKFTHETIKSLSNLWLLELNNFVAKEYSDVSFGWILLSSIGVWNSCNHEQIANINPTIGKFYSYRLDVFHSGLSPNFSYWYKSPNNDKPKVVFSYSNKNKTKMKHSKYLL